MRHARPAPWQHRRTPFSNGHFYYIYVAIALVATPAAQTALPPVAPAAGPTCDPAAVCETLAGFYRATSASSCTWRQHAGWSSAEDLCPALPRSANESGPAPPYCGWPGVLCCGRNSTFFEDALYDYMIADRTKLPQCAHRHAITALTLPANGLCGSLDAVTSALVNLHACGLTDVSLDGNRFTGTLPPALGQLTELRRVLAIAPLIFA